MELYWNTVTPSLRIGLELLMKEPLLKPFRLVGGTSLSLQRGHRMSEDIDLFTDAAYGSINFKEIDSYLRDTFAYVDPELPDIISFGVSYIAGNAANDSFKLDLYYSTDAFIRPIVEQRNIRLADIEDVIAMKIDVVQRGARKKDLWDLHELLQTYAIDEMIGFHKERSPYVHDEILIRNNLVDFTMADKDFDPVCLKGKYWEVIKADLLDLKTLIESNN